MNRFSMAAAVLLIAMSALPAAAEADPTRAEILASLGSDKVPADYVVLLDTSGSMAQGNRYITAVQALGGLFEALPAEDRIALYTFDSTTDPQYLGPSLPPADLLGKLPAAPDPSGSTDLGQAMSVALQELGRDGAAQVANVVIITDGAHDAPPGSPYADQKAPAWETLRQQAKKRSGQALSVYAVPLGDGTSGAAVVKSVFDGAIVLAPADVQNLREYLNRSKTKVTMDKARTVLGQDIGKSLDAKWDIRPVDGGNARVVVTLTSKMTNVPLEVGNVRMDAGAARVDIEPQQHVIEPGKSIEVNGSLVQQSTDDLFMRRPVTTETAVQLSATVRSGWTASLKPEIDLGVDRDFTTRSASVALTRTVGSPLFLPILVLLASALVASALYFGFRRGRALTGLLVVSSGAEPVEIAQFVLRGHRTVLDGGDLPGRGVVTPGGKWWDRRGAHLKISYTNAPGTRTPVIGRCGTGGSLILGGLTFSHFKNGD
ncbi:VWA domain-containing protein [Lentzea sp. NBC_00516]|uniref:vWA domain-containing protein n=1 Tax=Lentzea sp. NBC_00516 TaxID=2903582 RepID=UPI002E81DE41|nr:VWA domain-containing protein [Lentzea sp. NBC_00516]WUD21144.1 VWA domain-containing protein [Lentzea sp. NBC_00516]